MKFNRIEIEGFMSIGASTISLENKGLVLIQGENLDDTSQNSNGSGKSTLVEALQWALYGETARGDKGDAIVNRKLKKNTRVLVQFVDGDREYNVIRHRKHKDHKNRLLLLDVTDREDIVDMTLGTDKATQEMVERVVGCSADVFRAAVYSGQEQQIDLPALTDKALKVIVEESAGIDKMQQAYLIARKKLAEKSDAVTQVENQRVRKQDAIERSESQLKALDAKKAEWKTDQDSKRSALKESVLALSRDVKEQKAVLDTFNVADLELQLEKVKRDMAEIDGERQRELELEKQVANDALGLKEANRFYEQFRQEAQSLKIKLSQVESEIGSNCGECGQLIKESTIADRANSLKLQIANKVNDAKKQRDVVEQAKETLGESHDALKAHQLSMTDVSDLVDAQSALQAQLNTADKQRLTVKSLLDSLKREKARFDAMGEELNPYDSMIATEQETLAREQSALAKLDEQLAIAKHERTITGSVVDVFSPAGIRAHILDTVTPFLNDRTAQYLGTLSDGNIRAEWTTQTRTAKGELREKFGIEVNSLTGGDSYRSLSGGEKRKVRLATTLALQDLVSSRASKPIELWIGDEIDDAVDISGLERLMTVLEEKAKEKGTVLIISHNQLSDWVRQHVNVVKEDGIATVSGVLNMEEDEERL